MSRSIVKQSMKAARRGMLLAFAGAAIIVAGLVTERILFQESIVGAADEVARAQELAGAILLHDESLTMSAHMAAATGDRTWRARYEAVLPLLTQAIERARSMAPRPELDRFDAETSPANDALVAMEARAFDLVRTGALAQAREILASSGYAEQKRVFARGIADFSAQVVRAAENHLVEVRNRQILLVGLLTTAGFALLWRLLSRSLARSESDFAEAERQIRDLAMRDALTDLPNRRAFGHGIGWHVEAARASRGRLALLMLDLDRFKPINDLYGHGVGDAVLREIAQRMQAVAGESAMVARLGGDEFAILSPFETEADVLRLGRALTEALHEPIRVGALRNAAQVGVSIGTARYPADSEDAETLRQHADLALNAAKKAGRGQIRFFDPEMVTRTEERAAIEADLSTALIEGQIVPHFQALVCLDSLAIVGFEVLARWRHPARGQIAPDVFVPIAQEAGLITDLTLTMLRQACRAAATWPLPLPIALNVAPEQLQDRWLPERLLGVLTEEGFPAGRLEIEITENALVADFETARAVIVSLKNQGVRIALDDFGSGCSSLTHLSQLPIDKIKIDKSFVQSVAESAHSAAIVSTVIQLGQSLSMTTTAEGIESPELVARLRALGCDIGQGYLFARPMPAEAIPAMLGKPGLALALTPEPPMARNPPSVSKEERLPLPALRAAG